MNCWRGICRYVTENNQCMKDGKKCDIEKVGQCYHTCHYEKEHEDFCLSCYNACRSYDYCEVV